MIRIEIVKNKNMLKECFEIRKEVFFLEQEIPKELDKDEFDVLDLNKSVHAIEYVDNIPIGTARLKYISSDTVQINRVAVKKAYRKIGAGKSLLCFLENLAKEKCYSFSYIESQLQAKKFYEKCGYVNISKKPFTEVGILHVKMKKRLK